MAEHDYNEMATAVRELQTALAALDLAMTKHAGDKYLQGQAREHVWLMYWKLRAAAGDSPKGGRA